MASGNISDISAEPSITRLINRPAGTPLRTYFRKGDVIGHKYEVHRLLGIGGSGAVYLVYSDETMSVYALKSLHSGLVQDPRTKERFRSEAYIWVKLERHPFIVRALFVDEADGNIYVATEYVPPDEEGLNSLEQFLARRPPDLIQALRWSIQICHGMEYAYSKGLHSHRDLKPANILIGPDKRAKITDFGLANVLLAPGAACLATEADGIGGEPVQHTQAGVGFGTPTHMPPEQFSDAHGCEQRSDIYAFGITLYQMATCGKLPFSADPPRDDSRAEGQRFWNEMHRLHRHALVPKLESPLFPIIQRCLQKTPEARYQDFAEIRARLEAMLALVNGELIKPPAPTELTAWEWNNKGSSLKKLGRFEEAFACTNHALDIDPGLLAAWNNKGNILVRLDRPEDALLCYDYVLTVEARNAKAWNNKGNALARLKRYDEALECYAKALEIAPRFAAAWNNKGNTLDYLARHSEALRCYEKALECDPQYSKAAYNKGISYGKLGLINEAIRCYDQALRFNPLSPRVWNNKGESLDELGNYHAALWCFERAVEIDPGYAIAWYNKALAENMIGRRDAAVASLHTFLAHARESRHREIIRQAKEMLAEL